MKTKQTFEEYLRKGNLSENTITSYLWTVNYFTEHYDTVNKENLLAYKGYLMEFFKFAFYLMQATQIDHDNHQRYWISTYSQELLGLPPINEQKRILSALELYFALIEMIS